MVSSDIVLLDVQKKKCRKNEVERTVTSGLPKNQIKPQADLSSLIGGCASRRRGLVSAFEIENNGLSGPHRRGFHDHFTDLM